MNALRLALAGLLLVGVTTLAGAQEKDKKAEGKKDEKSTEGKVNKKHLMGSWEKKSGPAMAPSMMTFEKGGKVLLVVGQKAKTQRIPATYSLDGDQLKLTMKAQAPPKDKGKDKGKGKAGETMTINVTVKKLTRDTMVLTRSEEGKEQTAEYKKRKPKAE
jgi:uncharacterized protein (TIGR03066 family)